MELEISKEGTLKIYDVRVLKKKRLAEKLTSRQLDILARVTGNLTAQIDGGHRQPYPRYRAAVSRILGVEESELFPVVKLDE